MSDLVLSIIPSESSQQLYKVTRDEVALRIPEALNNIEKCSGSFRIFTRAHSDTAWSNFVINNNDSDTRSISQIAAELKQKRDALEEVKFNLLKKEAEAAIELEEAAKEEMSGSMAKAALHKIKAEEFASQARRMMEPILGATRDVAKLTSLYEQYEAKIIAKHGRFDEEIFEIEEKRYWVKRMFRQSLYGVRRDGHIEKGEQMSLDSMGFNPSAVEELLRNYVASENEQMKKSGQAIFGSEMLEAQLDEWSDRFCEVPSQALVRKGINPAIITDHLYKELPKGAEQ